MSEQNITIEHVELASAVLAIVGLMDVEGGMEALKHVLLEHGYDTDTYANLLDKATESLEDDMALEIFCSIIEESLPSVVKLGGGQH